MSNDISRDLYSESFANINKIYWSPIRVACDIFGTIFNSIKIPLFDKNGITKNTMTVPIAFAARSNVSVWLEDSKTRRVESSDGEIRKQFPRLSYDFTGIAMDNTRQTNPLLKNYIVDKTNRSGDFIHTGSFYTFEFKLSIWSKELMHSLMILNEILPFFKPELAIRVNQNKDLKLVEDCKVILKTISRTDNYAEGFDQNRIIEWDLDFSLNAQFTEKITQSSLITEIQLDIV